MSIRQAYNAWSSQYDTNVNRTRDLEGIALRTTLSSVKFDRCLEVGCGTGKNTEWLVQQASHITAVDLSEKMLELAKAKVSSEKVIYKQADITGAWTFAEGPYDLITFSLVLEHIQNLDHIFSNVVSLLAPGGIVYVGELHPFKQYAGTKARFDTESGRQLVECYDHHVSDFTQVAKKNGLRLLDVNEYFDAGDRTIPRILTVLLQKP